MTATAAILGVGRMGSAMAERLAGQGIPVVIFNRTLSRATDVAARLGPGVTVADTAAAAAAQADVIVSMVADDQAVHDLYLGADGVAAGIRSGSVAADMSTVMPDTVRSVAPAVQARGAGIIDAPVSGSVTTAVSGGLTLMVGGDGVDLDRARPILDVLAQRIFHLGPLGTGAAMKLAVNSIVFGLNEAVAEALVLAERSGIPRDAAYDVLAASAIGAPWVGYKRDSFLDPDGTRVMFSMTLEEKDLGLIGRQAETTGTQMPQVALNLDVLRAATVTLGGGQNDMAEVATHLRRASRTRDGTPR